MVEGAALQIVILWVLSARLNFERVQVQQQHCLAHSDVSSVETATVKVFIAIIRACVVLMVMLMLMQGLVVGYDGILGKMMIFKLRLRWLWWRL